METESSRKELFWKVAKFLWLMCGIYIPFIAYNFFRELLTKKYKWEWAQLLVWSQSLVNLIYCMIKFAIDGVFPTFKFEKQTSLYLWIVVGVFAILSMASSGAALSFVNYPTQVLARACKPISVLLFNVLIAKVKYPFHRYVTVVLMCLGICIFLLNPNKKKSTEHAFEYWGYILLFFSLGLDGVVNGLEQKLRTVEKPTPLQTMFYVNFFGFLFLTCIIGFRYDSELLPAVWYTQENPNVLVVVIVSSIVICIGTIFIFQTLVEYGTLVLAIATTIRKIITLLLSVLWYEHSMTLQMWTGVSLVFGSIFLDRYLSHQKSDHKEGNQEGKKVANKEMKLPQ